MKLSVSAMQPRPVPLITASGTVIPASPNALVEVTTARLSILPQRRDLSGLSHCLNSGSMAGVQGAVGTTGFRIHSRESGCCIEMWATLLIYTLLLIASHFFPIF